MIERSTRSFDAIKRNLLLILLYLITGFLSLNISSINAFTSVIFFPAGIAIAASLTYGPKRVVLGVVLGSFLLNLVIASSISWQTPAGYVVPLLIALASAAQAWLGSIMLKRWVSDPFTLSGDREILTFLVLIPIICLISSTLSVMSLYWLTQQVTTFRSTWASWWVGDSLGLLVTLPVVMCFIGKPKKLWRSRRTLLGVQLLTAIIVIVVLTLNIKQFEQNRLADRFNIRTQEAASLFQTALRTEELVQDSVAQLFVSSEGVTREKFREFVHWATDKSEHIQVVEWLPRVEQQNRLRYELQQREYFGEGFSITEFIGPNKLGAAKQRDVYYPITFLEPEWNNNQAKGFDPTSSAEPKAAIQQAIESGQAVARGPLKILRDNKRINVLIIYRAIYQTADGNVTLTPDSGEVMGLISIVIRIDDFVQTILNQSQQQNYTLKWLDVQSGDYYFHQADTLTSSIRHEAEFIFAGRPMRFTFSPTQVFIHSNATNLAVFVLIGGFLLAGLFSLLFLSISGRTHRVASEVSRRTEELSRASLRAQASEQRIREVLHEMQQAEINLKLSDVAFNSTSEAMMITDENTIIIAVNAAFTRITGFSEYDVIGQYPDFMVAGFNDLEQKKYTDEFWTAMNEEGIWRGEVKSRRLNEEIFPAHLSMSAVYDAEHTITNMVGVFSDITDVKRAQAQIEHHANYDALTGLPNRRLFTDRLQQAILHSGRNQEKLCLMFLDLDRFKDVNDTLGHEFGDELLSQMGVRIEACVRQVDTVARLGGDEFTIILDAIDAKSDAVGIAQKLISEIEAPITIKQQTLRVTTSIGITFYPDDASDAGMLIQNADRAMYAAKDMGGSAFKFYTSELESSWRSRTFILNELEAAIEKGEIAVYYQPLVAAAAEEDQIYAEALVRWHHPDRGLIPPSEFLPQAERMGMIERIDDFVFSQVCLNIKSWQAQGWNNVHVSVNRSAHNFANQRGRLDWIGYMKKQGVDSRLITLEITESVLMQRQSESRHLLHKLRDAGVQIAVDDFGTGYSSLSYLKEMDVDYLKVDQSFIRDLESDENDRAIIEAITDMAKHLGIQVIAEGVETENQSEILSQIGCHWLQGYYFSKPLSLDDFELYISTVYFDDEDKKRQTISDLPL